MSRSRDAVHEAIGRWEEDGLIGAALADTLRGEVMEHSGQEGRRWAQYALAATAAALTLIAASVFLRWAWPIMGAAARTTVLGVAGLALMFLGMAMEHRDRSLPVSYLLQTAGLAVLLLTYGYSETAWADASIGGLAIGLLALATPFAAAGLAISRNAFMPAVHTALGYAFLFLFLDRATTLEADTIIWILDAVLIVSVLLFVVALRRNEEPGWMLNAFVASLYAGLVLVVATMLGPLDAGEEAAFALDLWLLVVTALTLWGIHRAPPGLRRGWYDRQLALCVLFAIPLAFWTTLEALDASEIVTSIAVAAVGASGLLYGLRHQSRELIATSCLALLVAAWYFGTTQGGALGAVLGLGFSAALLFWVAAGVGRRAELSGG